jgi:hypothetical protein
MIIKRFKTQMAAAEFLFKAIKAGRQGTIVKNKDDNKYEVRIFARSQR